MWNRVLLLGSGLDEGAVMLGLGRELESFPVGGRSGGGGGSDGGDGDENSGGWDWGHGSGNLDVHYQNMT